MPPKTETLLYLEPVSAVMARVAYQVIWHDFYREPSRYEVPAVGLLVLSEQLGRQGFPGLSLWVCSYAYYLRRGMPTAAFRQWLIRRARWAALNRQNGKPWARVPSR